MSETDITNAVTYYAHSENNSGELHTLKEHLTNTAQIARDFGHTSLQRSMFFIAGLLHDLGKYQPEFQRYLLEGGRRGSVPHSAMGSGYARLLRFLEISFVIDGHHKGLPDRSVWQNDTDEFQESKLSLLDRVSSEYLRDTGLSDKDLKHDADAPPTLERELLIRYMFSALTDADWLDTESHFNPSASNTRSSKTLNIGEMLNRLDMEFANKSKEGEINRLRNEVRNKVLENANKPVGFYSLNLPTGMGKTLTSTAWALNHAKANSLKRIIIVLPYINIIDQTASILKGIFGDEIVLEHHSQYNENPVERNNDSMIDSLSYRKRLACENWDYPIIVTTTVQFFESLFSNRPSRCRKIHNIAESVVIFDEVQTLPKEIIAPTLTMLSNVNSIMRTSFLFCTATQPAFEKRPDFDGIENIIPLIKDPAAIFNKTRRVTYTLFNNLDPVDLQTMYKFIERQNESALVIFNTKKEALQFYSIIHQNNGTWERTYHLSTSMCPAHRKSVIGSIRGDIAAKRKILVASTQLIEAGVDFDFPCVFRAIAPLEGIIQSAGRCNREGTLPEPGKVFLFQLEDMRMPDKTYKACAEHAKNMICNDITRLHTHDYYKDYYSQVLTLFVDPDTHQINDARSKFKFETVNDIYHLIDKPTESIFIPGYDAESMILFNALIAKDALTRDDYRKMQQYSVQVFPDFIRKNAESLETMPQDFRVWHGVYDRDTGIAVEPMASDELVV